MGKSLVRIDYEVRSKWLTDLFNALGVPNNYPMQTKLEYALKKYVDSIIEKTETIIVNIKNDQDVMTTHHIKPTYIKLYMETGRIAIHGVVEDATVTCVGSNRDKTGNVNIGNNWFYNFTFMRGDVFDSRGLIKGKNCLIETTIECSDLINDFINTQGQKLLGGKIE
jgi:hypothetical protein